MSELIKAVEALKYPNAEGDMIQEHYNEALDQAIDLIRQHEAKQRGANEETLIQVLRPYLHFGTSGWRRVAEAAVKAISPYLRTNSVSLMSAEVVEKLKAGWELSTWAGCINWRGGSNETEWLEELRQKIESYQDGYRAILQEQKP